MPIAYNNIYTVVRTKNTEMSNKFTEEHTKYIPVKCVDYKLLICLDLKAK